MTSQLGQLIAIGRTSDVYRYGRDGAVKVLYSTTPQHWAELEASFTRAVHELGAPVPEVREVVDVEGRAAVVFDRIDGPSMWQQMLEQPGDVAALTQELIEIQRGLHEAGVPDGLPSLVDRIGIKLEAAEELTDGERGAARDLLDRQPIGAALLHGDLHPGNVLLSRSGPVVIDWFDATVGHPAADIARTMLLLSTTATDLRHLPGATTPLAAQLHVHFAKSAGERVPPDRLRNWTRLCAAGRLSEQTDLDVSGLVGIWRGSMQDSVVDDD